MMDYSFPCVTVTSIIFKVQGLYHFFITVFFVQVYCVCVYVTCIDQIELTTLYLFRDERCVLIVRKRAFSEWAWLEFLNSTLSSRTWHPKRSSL